MRLSHALLLSLLLAAPAAAAPIETGKVTWGANLEEALRTARYERKPVVILFTVASHPPSVALARGALSDDQVVAAFKGVVAVVLDCSEKDAHLDPRQRYQVSEAPTLVFLDHEGKPIGNMAGPQPAPDVFAALRTSQARVAEATKPKPRPTGPKAGPGPADTSPGRRLTVHELPSLEAALDKAREEGKLLALVFTMPEQVRREPDTQAVVDALRAPTLKATAPRFLYVWQPLCDDLGLDTKDAEAWRAKKSPSLVVIDPWAEVKEGERRPALVTVNKVTDIQGELGRALVEAARAGHPPPSEDEERKPAR